jgi:putative N-acetyltransferase (TIGR04045 family)
VAELLSTPRHRIGDSCRIAEDERSVQWHHRIRFEVFVGEQALFTGSDRDGHDSQPATIKVLGRHDGVPSGAVRLYPTDIGRERWQGDRLAVLPAIRRHRLGVPLVRFAVATAAERGGSIMTAHIQLANVRFFEDLGWRRDGGIESYVGVPHQPMAIDLKAAGAAP